MPLYLQILPRKIRVHRGVKKNIGHEVTFVGAIALIVHYRLYDPLCPLGTEYAGHIAGVIPYVPEGGRKDLAGIDLAGLCEHQIQSPCITGDEPSLFCGGLMDKSSLENVLRSLDSRAPEAICAGKPFFQVFLKPFDGVVIFANVHVLALLMGRVTAYERNGMGFYMFQSGDKLDNLIHAILIFRAKDGIDSKLEMGIFVY